MNRIYVLIAAVSVLLLGCTGSRVTEAQALQAAKDRFVKVCANFHYTPLSFSGPTKTVVGGAAFAYEWKETAPASDFGVLITVDETGSTNVSLLGTLPQQRAVSVKAQGHD